MANTPGVYITADQDIVRKRFEEERARKAKANQKVRARVAVFSRIVAWLVAAFFMAMALVALYMEYPLLDYLIDGHREGWVPTNFLLTFLFLAFGLIASLIFWVVLLWKSRRSIDPGQADGQ